MYTENRTLSVLDSVADIALCRSVEALDEDLELLGGLVRQQTEQFLILSAARRLGVDLVHLLPLHDSVTVQTVQQTVEPQVEVVDEKHIVLANSFSCAAVLPCTESKH